MLAVPYEEEALVQVGPGIYREKLVCEKRCITLRGVDADKTKLVWGDGGKLPHKDGRPTHTFRSYTAFFSGETLWVEDMTIENDAGPGAKAGQAVAAYVDSTRAVFRRVKLLGSQDTLFCAPLPEKEREDVYKRQGVERAHAVAQQKIGDARIELLRQRSDSVEVVEDGAVAVGLGEIAVIRDRKSVV